MNISKLNLVYFSATNTTKKILTYISEGINIKPVDEYNIFQGFSENIYFSNNEVVVFGVPVYSGRIPAIAVDSLKYFKGNSTPAIIACVYGNREYEDALLELRNIVEANNFKVIAAAAFVAEHSIFPEVANGRPDEQDKLKAIGFGKKCIELSEVINELTSIPEIKVKGNFPYRLISRIPLKPKGNSKCNKCGACVKACPVKAIDAKHPRRTNKEFCISCAHCIKICPQDSRHFGGIIYKIARKKFVTAYSMRKEPEVFFYEYR